jgi:glutamine amidotransferase
MEFNHPLIGIVDYGCGNLKPLKNIIKSLKYSCVVSNNIFVLKKTKILILPGVGNFNYAMKNIIKLGLKDFIIDFSKDKKKLIIGICLGMQIMFSYGYEGKKTKGLNLIKGKVVRFKKLETNIGWNDIKFDYSNKDFFLGFKNKYYYFNHSYYVRTKKIFVIASSKFSDVKFSAVVKKDNLVGFQFHPEKSQLSGKKILKNTINLFK